MITIEDLEEKPQGLAGKTYFIPNTLNNISLRPPIGYEVWVYDKGFKLLSKNGELVDKATLLPASNYYPFLFKNLQSALDAYNRWATPLLHENTDVLSVKDEMHGVE